MTYGAPFTSIDLEPFTPEDKDTLKPNVGYTAVTILARL